MQTKYALLDLENIQPASLEKFQKEGFSLKVFVGANQPKISVELAQEIQGFGERAQYIRVQESGKNALDFYIAFYMGQLSCKEPSCQIVVISKDTGYDPLLKHMRSIGVKSSRVGTTQAKAPPPASTKATTKKTPTQMSLQERVQFAKKHLIKANKAKPAKLSTLATDLHSKFQKKLTTQAVQALIDELIKQGIVVDNQGSISYQLTP
ncbi:hypothetical protein BXT89_00730 [Halopseudomonas pachastrellae]|uniref:PIN-like domain-containing protein n=1 Tax=Halopseudomonas pachastrellae TaxID=254161 RepID=A0A1S8DM16_9GAMM|nr:PIN domain-containing protein [Halopseudomonas pachastrellae]ONM45856.1 hypothetical protein BXT89_00730 [Halopseudomonas pachastrellae]SFL97852.1 hypothetical protein SAMN05216256_10462 [Halopseudomonas pachastrellae]